MLFACSIVYLGKLRHVVCQQLVRILMTNHLYLCAMTDECNTYAVNQCTYQKYISRWWW